MPDKNLSQDNSAPKNATTAEPQKGNAADGNASKTKMDVLQRNFFRLLRSGAFDESTSSTEPMSAYKWRRLYQIVEAQRVVPEFVRGVNRHTHDDALRSLPDDLIDTVNKRIDDPKLPRFQILRSDVVIATPFIDKRLYRVFHDERHAIDTSTESLELLRIIVANTHIMLCHGLQLGGIIALGNYLRMKGDKVDFVKIDSWISRLHIRRMASLQGQILTEFFGFQADEIPFLRPQQQSSRGIVKKSMTHVQRDTAQQEWHFRLSSTGFVQGNSSVTRRNLRRSILYMPYAPMETVSNMIRNLGHSLREIEE